MSLDYNDYIEAYICYTIVHKFQLFNAYFIFRKSDLSTV